MSVEAVAGVMGRLIQEGLIHGWGVSQVSAGTLKRAHDVTPVTAVQNLYNILERDCEADIFPYCLENNIGVVPFSPVASGFLSGKITTATEFEKSLPTSRRDCRDAKSTRTEAMWKESRVPDSLIKSRTERFEKDYPRVIFRYSPGRQSAPAAPVGEGIS